MGDMTLEEFQALPMFGFVKPESAGPNLGTHEWNGEGLAASVDWRSKGAVTPVKNQGQRGSCWAFSTVGGLEGAWEIGTGTLTSMSEQQFVDCSKANSGCNGGLMDSAFQYAEGVAVATESSYPYTARDGSCKSSYTTAIPRGGVNGYHDVYPSTSSLQSALVQQPVSVAIQADQSVFQRYSGGVITSGCGSQLDHGVCCWLQLRLLHCEELLGSLMGQQWLRVHWWKPVRHHSVRIIPICQRRCSSLNAHG